MFQNISPSNVKNADVFVLNWNDYLKERVTNECVKFYNHFGQNIISRFDLGAFAMVRKATIRFLKSVRMEQLVSNWTDLMKFYI
jgi:hypothetical protein